MIIKIVLVKYHPQPPRAHHGAQEWHARTTRKAHRTCQGESQEIGGARNPAWALLDLLSLLNN